MNTVYQIVTADAEGRMSAETFNDLAAVELRYGQPVSYANRRGLRAELQGQPQFAKLVGPMWNGHDKNGAPVVRYEDGYTNDRMSA